MKKYLFVLFIFQSIYSHSQKATLRITLLDSITQKPIELASATIIHQTSKKIFSALSDTQGVVPFRELEYGNYLIKTKAFGYMAIDSQFIDVSSVEVLRTFYVHPNNALLSEVKIVEKRSEVVFDGNKTIVNVGSDIGNDGGNLKDVMENAPGVQVDNNNTISLLGKSGVKVLINGKENNRTKNMKMFLENLRASLIDKIEIMPNPPARYSAEGTAGVINIIMKKGVDEFLEGSVSARIDRFGSSGGNIELGHSNDNFSIRGTIDGNYDRGNGFEYKSINNNSTDSVFSQKSYSKAYWSGPSISPTIDVEYTINDYNTLSAYIGYEAEWSNYKDYDYDSFLNVSQQPVLLVSRFSNSNILYHGFNAGLDYEKGFANENNNFLFSINFENSTYGGNKYFTDDANGFKPYVKKRLLVDRDKDYSLDSRIECNKEIDSMWALNIGYQLTHDYRNSYIEISQDYSLNDNYTLYNQNHFTFKQFVNSVYSTINGKVGMFKLNAGIRFEHTYNTGLNNGFAFTNTYFGFYPNVSITSNLNKSNSITFNYSRRLMRPWVYMLMEMTFSSDDRSVWTGNNSLKPSISNSYSLAYNYNKNKWTLNVNVNFSDNYNNIAWSNQRIVNGVVYRTNGNFGESKNVGLFAFINYKPYKFWDITATVYTGLTFINKSASVFVQNKSSFSSNFSLKNQWKIKKHVILYCNMWYMPKTKTNTGESFAVFDFEPAIKLLLLKSKLGITLNAENIFNLANWGNSFVGEDFTTTSQWFYNRPNVQLTLVYHFGKDKKESDTIRKAEGGGIGRGMK